MKIAIGVLTVIGGACLYAAGLLTVISAAGAHARKRK